MEFLTLTSGSAFSMGKGRNWRVVHPDMGAEWITLNHALHDPGNEFVQHVHDGSSDIIVVLAGCVSLRQGARYTLVNEGDAVFVPAGEVHGTVNLGDRITRMISFQSPPDTALYRGERNRPSGERPEPSASHASGVLVVRMEAGGPDFRADCDWRRVFPAGREASGPMLEYARMEPGQVHDFAAPEREAVLVLLSGTARVLAGTQSRDLRDDDVLLFRSGENLRIECGEAPCRLLVCSSVGEGGAA